MRLDRIVCLANSYKHDNRCVAGISLVTKKWLRLVGRVVPGCLTREEARYADGREAALLDVFEAELGEECSSKYHPEDVLITGTPWKRIQRFGNPYDADILTSNVNREPVVLEGYCDRIDAHKLEATPARISLTLVQPEDLWWWIREDRGKRRNRAVFHLGKAGRVHYDLSVTDPAWLDQLNLLPAGIHPNALLCDKKAQNTYLTVSLSESYEGFHYKLVAGVVNLRAQ
jgi:hypothetical protein